MVQAHGMYTLHHIYMLLHYYLTGSVCQSEEKVSWVARMGRNLSWFPAHEVLGQHLCTGLQQNKKLHLC